jgi:hypothetical protein
LEERVKAFKRGLTREQLANLQARKFKLLTREGLNRWNKRLLQEKLNADKSEYDRNPFGKKVYNYRDWREIYRATN